MNKKILAVVMAVIVAMSVMSVSVFAAEGGSTQVTYDDVSDVIKSITGFFSVQTIVAVLAGVLTAVMGFVFLWWAVRKVVKIAMAAIRKGRVTT